ncbi:hypothetical protein EMN47_19325 [Prolixibacteraceae bacterium JC049]|nr:hypothetical protein [Prolixibacteraceae bacterium JC049]
MMRVLRSIAIVACFLFCQSCYQEEIIFSAEPNNDLELPLLLNIDHKVGCLDDASQTLRFSIDESKLHDYKPKIKFQKFAKVYFEGKELVNREKNPLGNIVLNKAYRVAIEAGDKRREFKVSFTNLPTVQVITPNEITDEPKTMARIVVNYPKWKKKPETYIIGIEYRGKTSRAYAKKSYGISLKSEFNFDTDESASFFGLKPNNDWILDAMYIDRARLRNKTSFELWQQINGNAHYGISGELVELFLNNERQGIYCFNEKINAEHLALTSPKAVLYKAVEWEDGATKFETYSQKKSHCFYWDGWEQEYPDAEEVINWEPLADLRYLIVKEKDANFKWLIEEAIDMNNFMDYYLFLNLVSAVDNTGKNTFLAKRDAGKPFVVIPWDIDGAWGLFWNGEKLNHTSILSNDLYKRLKQLNPYSFKQKLKERWLELRTNVFSEENIRNHFNNNFNDIRKSGVIAIENDRWDLNIDLNEEQQFLLEWTKKRLAFLDDYFRDL